MESDLRAVGIDAQAVADAVGDVADEQPLRPLLAPGAALVARVAEAIPSEAERAALIAQASEDEQGHGAQAGVGVVSQ